MNENIFVVLLNYNNILALSSGWREIKAILILKIEATLCLFVARYDRFCLAQIIK